MLKTDMRSFSIVSMGALSRKPDKSGVLSRKPHKPLSQNHKKILLNKIRPFFKETTMKKSMFCSNEYLDGIEFI